MAIRSAIVTAGTAATLLHTGGETDSVTGRQALITNTGAVTVFLGPSGVTTATGYPLAAGATLPWQDYTSGDLVYGIVVTGTCTVAVLQLGV